MAVPFSSCRRVVLATGNPGKLREMRAILEGHGLEVIAQSELGIRPPPEDGASFVENAISKARHAASASGLPAIADDSGLEVDALGGRPGIHSARYAGADATDGANNDKLLAELAGVPTARRQARYRCAMVFVRDAADPSPIVAEASWEGRIGSAPQGSGGFGYDPLFVAAEREVTAAELPADEKNQASHRGKALRLLAERMHEMGW